jgi:nucleoside-diphosphate-sugar epimerase
VDDLVASICAAMDRPAARGAYNVTDGDHSSTTAYLQEIAAAAGMREPKLVTRTEAARSISPGMLAFLLESRRVSNERMLAELGVRLQYPDMRSGVRASLAEMRMEDAR